MKQTLLFLFTIFSAGLIIAQPCNPDPDFVSQGVGVYPFPFNQAAIDTGNTDYVGIQDTAVVGQDYNFVFTAVVPDSLTFGASQVALEWVIVDSIQNLPEGLSFECDVVGCQFEPAVDGVPNSGLGCVAVSGQTTAAPGSYSIIVYAQAKTGISPNAIPVTFPPDEDNVFGFPEGEYLVHVREGDGTQVEELSSRINTLHAYPNPFTNETAVTFTAESTGSVEFNVYDLSGKQVFSDEISMRAGENEYIFNGSQLSEGVYLYGLKGDRINVINKFTLNR